MDKSYIKMALLFLSLFIFTSVASATNSKIKGIYVTQWNFQNTSFVKYLIKHAKAAGIDTFVVDLERPDKKYQQNLDLLKENNIKYVARIIMFPDGGTPAIIKNPEKWQRKYSLVKQAVDWGAKEIQLDYIRYKSSQKPSQENARDILTIIQWYKNKLLGQNIPLQIDVFGVTSFGESKYIGQNIKLFSQSVDAICPMVYPSHYWPFQKYYKIPYQTVYGSLTRIKRQFDGEKSPMKIYAYIELSNYHYPKMSKDQKIVYIKAQLKAVEEAGADGWYAWSPHNRYENLFAILQARQGNKDVAEDIAEDDDDEHEEDAGTKRVTTVDSEKESSKQIQKIAENDVKINPQPAAKEENKAAVKKAVQQVAEKNQPNKPQQPVKQLSKEERQTNPRLSSSLLPWFSRFIRS